MRIKHILPKQGAEKKLKEGVLNELSHFSDMPNDPITYHGALIILSKELRKKNEHFASEEDADEIKEVARIFFKQGMTAGRRALMMADTKEAMLDWLEDKGFNVEAEIIQPYREEQAGHRANAVIDRIRWSSSPKAMDQAANNVEITALATQGTSPHYKPGYQLQSNSFDQRKRSDIKAELAKLKQAMAQRFGGDAPIEYKITIGGKPVDIANLAEDAQSSGVVRFVVDTERAYQAVIKRFGNLIDYDENDYLVIPERLWPKVEQVAYDADGVGAERVDDIAEGEVVKFPERHPWYHVTNCPECGGPLLGGKSEGRRVKACLACPKFYLEPNSLNKEKQKPKDVDESDISGLLAASHLNKSFIITAQTAEGATKRYRVKAQSERVAKEKFTKHHSMAKILNVQEEH